MSSVVNFNQKKNPPKKVSNSKKVDKELIQALENMLQDAKNGDIKGFAGVVLSDFGTMESIYSGEIYDNYLSFIGMLGDLKMQLKITYEDL